MRNSQFLITEGSFHASYLLSQWLTEVSSGSPLGGVLLREERQSADLYRARWEFHRSHAGQHLLSELAWKELRELYRDLSEVERAMIRSMGIPSKPRSANRDVQFVSRDLNSEASRRWLEDRCRNEQNPFFYIFLDRILAPWWIELSRGRIINAHSAVLPFARGIFAIEQIAASGDPDLFRRASGATIHYEHYSKPQVIEKKNKPRAASYASR